MWAQSQQFTYKTPRAAVVWKWMQQRVMLRSTHKAAQSQCQKDKYRKFWCDVTPISLAHLSTSRRDLLPYSTSFSACLTRGSSSANSRLARYGKHSCRDSAGAGKKRQTGRPQPQHTAATSCQDTCKNCTSPPDPADWPHNAIESKQACQQGRSED